MKKQIVVFPIVMLLVISLVACNLPSAQPTETPMSIDSAFTAAAETVAAQLTSNELTQAASVPLATNTPIAAANTSTPTVAVASNTPLPQPSRTQSCDLAQFVSDVTVQDGTSFAAGETFTKTWRIKNVGTCSWTPSYSLAFASDNQMNGPASVALTGNVNPGDSVDLSVNLTAPGTAGDYTGYWRLRNAAGGSVIQMYVKIKVGGTPGATAGPSVTPAKFAVTSVTFSATGGCSSFTATAKVTANGAGTVTYRWVRSDGAVDDTLHPALIFESAGSQSVSTSWATTDSGAKWIRIYIDEPNHQEFGQADFTCP